MRHRVPFLQLVAALVSAGSAAAQNSSEQVQLAIGGPRFLAVPVGTRSATAVDWGDAQCRGLSTPNRP